MLNNIQTIVNVKYIEGCYINTLDGQIKVLIEIIDVKNDDKSLIFQSLIDSIEEELKFISIKSTSKFDRYEDYFAQMINCNLDSSNLKKVLQYIENFKKCISELNNYNLFLIVSSSNLRFNTKHILHILEKLNIVYKIQYEEEINSLINNLFI